MTTTPACRRIALAAAILLFLPVQVAAQDTGAATGTIYDLKTGLPVEGAKVTVTGTKKSSKTREDGSFRIDRLEPGELLVRVDANGYVRQVEKIIVDAGWTTAVELGLTPMVAMLDALVVQAGLGRIESEAVTKSAVIAGDDADGDTFNRISRIPGVQVMRPSGTTGSGGRILMRGISSFSLSSDPVIYVDGVRVGGNQQTYGLESRGPQGRAAYLLDVVDPRDIDRIEVLRGPATAVRFGIDAASGVILIYTKRGGGV